MNEKKKVSKEKWQTYRQLDNKSSNNLSWWRHILSATNFQDARDNCKGKPNERNKKN